MSLRYLPEHAEAASLALALAEKEASYPAYTQHNAPLFLDALLSADRATHQLIGIVSRLREPARTMEE